MKAAKRIIAVLIAAVIIFIGIFIYISYFYYTEGRNSEQNTQALHISVMINSALADPAYSFANEDMILSSDKSLEYNNNLSESTEDILDKMSALSGIAYDKGVYYIEVRNGKVYRTIYAKWKYSGYVGTSPDPNNECRIYQKEADKAAEGFSKYLNAKNSNKTPL